jgi:hypothetical protein
MRKMSDGSKPPKAVFDLQSGMPMSMNGIMYAYMELPGRLMQCRTPFEMWREQALFAGRLFDLMDRGSHRERPRKA